MLTDPLQALQALEALQLGHFGSGTPIHRAHVPGYNTKAGELHSWWHDRLRLEETAMTLACISSLALQAGHLQATPQRILATTSS